MFPKFNLLRTLLPEATWPDASVSVLKQTLNRFHIERKSKGRFRAKQNFFRIHSNELPRQVSARRTFCSKTHTYKVFAIMTQKPVKFHWKNK